MAVARSALIALIALIALALLAGGCGKPAPEVRAGLAVAEALGGDAAGFARATAPRAFRFPEDHGPHNGFRTEWWYFTGHLDAAEGRRFGFQLTFFRNALAPDMPERSSEWAARHVHMAHFALTDVGAGRFHHAERFAREAAGLAGAEGRPFAVWLEDWSARAEVARPAAAGTEAGSRPETPRGAAASRDAAGRAAAGGAAAGADPPAERVTVRLRAEQGDAALDLVLEQGKPPVLQGDAGLSRKGSEPGNASYYYSLTRLHARGRVRAGGAAFDVQGSAWMDREWSTSALGADLAGWDWYALQLTDGRELMFYRLRRKDGGMDALSKGSLVRADGSYRVLAASDVEIEDLARWTSPRSGASYPARWRLRVPSEGLDLELRPVLADQELRGLVTYWEGAADVTGSAPGRAYVEMTGYEKGVSPAP